MRKSQQVDLGMCVLCEGAMAAVGRCQSNGQLRGESFGRSICALVTNGQVDEFPSGSFK